MRLREFAERQHINEVFIAPLVPYLIPILGAAGAALFMKQNPQVSKQLEKKVTGVIDNSGMADAPPGTNPLAAPIANAIKNVVTQVQKGNEPTQAQIDKRIDNALDAAGQRIGGERTKAILDKAKQDKKDSAADANAMDIDTSPSVVKKAQPDYSNRAQSPGGRTAQQARSAGTTTKSTPVAPDEFTTVTPSTKADTDKTKTPPTPMDAGEFVGTGVRPGAGEAPSAGRDAGALVPGTNTGTDIDAIPGSIPGVGGRTQAEIDAGAGVNAQTQAQDIATTVPQTQVMPPAGAVIPPAELQRQADAIRAKRGPTKYLYKGKKDIGTDKVVQIGAKKDQK